MTPRGGEFLCQTLNAEMYLPLTKKNFYVMLNGTDSNVLAKCPLFYTPFQLNEDEKWVDRKGKAKPSTLPWSPSEPNGAGLQRCTHIRPDNYAIYDIFCESSAAGCPICKFTEKPVLLLKGIDDYMHHQKSCYFQFHYFFKGLCPKSSVEYRYVLEIGQSTNEMLVFKGFNELFLVFNKDMSKWMISKQINSSSADDIIGMQVEKSATPIGLQEWNMMSEDCNGVKPLKLTSVSRTLEMRVYFVSIND